MIADPSAAAAEAEVPPVEQGPSAEELAELEEERVLEERMAALKAKKAARKAKRRRAPILSLVVAFE